jgi:hypothetical protein
MTVRRPINVTEPAQFLAGVAGSNFIPFEFPGFSPLRRLELNHPSGFADGYNGTFVSFFEEALTSLCGVFVPD